MLTPSKIKYLHCSILMNWSSRHRITSVRFRTSTTHSSICIWLAKTNWLALIYMLVSSKLSWMHTRHCRITSTISILEMSRYWNKLFMMLAPTANAKIHWITFWTFFLVTWRITTVTFCFTCMRALWIFNNLSTRDGRTKWQEFRPMQSMWPWSH